MGREVVSRPPIVQSKRPGSVDVFIMQNESVFFYACCCSQTVRDKCFKVCVPYPSTSLSSSEQKCLGRCMDRYQDVSV